MNPMYYEIAISWFAGWTAGIFWIGMDKDAPKPGGGGPLKSLVLGAIGGAAAVLFAIVADMDTTPLVTIGVALVVGSFAATLAAPFVGRGKQIT
jgi:hypothetical protein